MPISCILKAFLGEESVTIGCELVDQREVDDCALVDLVVRQHEALPEGVRHIDLLTEVVHLLLEQFELIHVELLMLLSQVLIFS